MSTNTQGEGTSADFVPSNRKDSEYGEFDHSDIAAITIDRPREELYAFWRDVGNLQTIMDNVRSITPIDATASHWVVEAPGGGDVEWDSLITEDEPGERIAWRSTDDSEVKNSGWIEFREGPLGRGTEVRAFISYDPPFGPLGDMTAKMLAKDPGAIARIELRRLKQLMETGEISTAKPPHAAPRAET